MDDPAKLDPGRPNGVEKACSDRLGATQNPRLWFWLQLDSTFTAKIRWTESVAAFLLLVTRAVQLSD